MKRVHIFSTASPDAAPVVIQLKSTPISVVFDPKTRNLLVLTGGNKLSLFNPSGELIRDYTCETAIYRLLAHPSGDSFLAEGLGGCLLVEFPRPKAGT